MEHSKDSHQRMEKQGQELDVFSCQPDTSELLFLGSVCDSTLLYLYTVKVCV